MHEEMENIHPKETATEKAVRKLEEAFEDSNDLTAEEIEEEILAVPGAEEGEGLEKLREKARKEEKEKKKKRTIH